MPEHSLVVQYSCSLIFWYISVEKSMVRSCIKVMLNRNDSMLKVNLKSIWAYKGYSKLSFSTTLNHKEIKQMVCNASQLINFHKRRLVTETNFHPEHCQVNKGKWSELLILTIAHKTSIFFLQKSNITDSTLNRIIFTKSRFFLNDNFKINWTNLRRNTSQSHTKKKKYTKQA